jgi:tetratricopeptide (TPR) repeat protein
LELLSTYKVLNKKPHLGFRDRFYNGNLKRVLGVFLQNDQAYNHSSSASESYLTEGKMKNIFWLRCIFFIVMISGLAWAQDAAQYLTAANQLYNAKDYTKAVQYYQATTQINPNSVEAYQGLGNSYYAMNRNAEALTAYEKALQLNPNNTQLASFVKTLKTQTGTFPSLPAASSGTMPIVNTPHLSTPKTFELSPMAGVAIGMNEGVGLGFGGGVGGHYLISPNFGIGGTIGYRSFSSSVSHTRDYIYPPSYTASQMTVIDNTTGIFEILGSVKYILNGNEFRPFFVGGAGLALYSVSGKVHSVTKLDGKTVSDTTTASPGGSASYPMIELGAGANYSLGNNMDLFGQVSYNV